MSQKNQRPCSCGGVHYEQKDGHKIDVDNPLRLNNPWGKTPTEKDLKLCKKCWFEKRNGHAQTCPERARQED